jgi:hypothetical protein
MLRALQSIIVSAATAFAVQSHGGQPDAELRNNIIGTWYVQAPSWASQTFYTNGTSVYRRDLLATNSTTEVTAYLEETWRIENGVLITTVMKTSNPDVTPLGAVFRGRIIRIDSEEAVLISAAGVTNRVQRKK